MSNEEAIAITVAACVFFLIFIIIVLILLNNSSKQSTRDPDNNTNTSYTNKNNHNITQITPTKFQHKPKLSKSEMEANSDLSRPYLDKISAREHLLKFHMMEHTTLTAYIKENLSIKKINQLFDLTSTNKLDDWEFSNENIRLTTKNFLAFFDTESSDPTTRDLDLFIQWMSNWMIKAILLELVMIQSDAMQKSKDIPFSFDEYAANIQSILDMLGELLCTVFLNIDYTNCYKEAVILSANKLRSSGKQALLELDNACVTAGDYATSPIRTIILNFTTKYLQSNNSKHLAKIYINSIAPDLTKTTAAFYVYLIALDLSLKKISHGLRKFTFGV